MVPIPDPDAGVDVDVGAVGAITAAPGSLRAQLILTGERGAAARLMRDLDDGIDGASEDLAWLYPHTGKAFVIGVTGMPGVGKSTLVAALIGFYRAAGQQVGVVAVDPSSPFSGGALLGDRVRMQRHATDDGVFIRSLATRGQLGGLSRSTVDVVGVLDAAGFDRILVETVGVGQAEVDVMSAVDVVVVVGAPGLGDEVQALKAGILEIADVLVVNKGDREGADRAVKDLTTMLALSRRARPSRGPAGAPEADVAIVRTVASTGAGVDQLVAAIDRCRSDDPAQRAARRHRQAEAQLLAIAGELARESLRALTTSPAEGTGPVAPLQNLVEEVAARRRAPHAAARDLLAALSAALAASPSSPSPSPSPSSPSPSPSPSRDPASGPLAPRRR